MSPAVCVVLWSLHAMYTASFTGLSQLPPSVMDHAISDVFTSVNYDLHPQYTIHIKLYHLRSMDGWIVVVVVVVVCSDGPENCYLHDRQLI